jgi:hypothetical protein
VIQLLHARCRACEYDVTVGVGEDDGATAFVVWAPALCRPAASLSRSRSNTSGPTTVTGPE